MLVLKLNQNAKGDDTVIVTLPDGQRLRVVLTEVRGGGVKIGFDGPRSLLINRESVQMAIDAAKETQVSK